MYRGQSLLLEAAWIFTELRFAEMHTTLLLDFWILHVAAFAWISDLG